MALEAVVFPQDPFFYGCKDLYSLVEAAGGGGGGGGGESSVGTWGHENLQDDEKGLLGIFDNNGGNLHVNWDCSSPSVLQNVKDQCQYWETNSSSPEACTGTQHSQSPAPELPPLVETALPSVSRRKRRRTRSTKNKDEIENQRMTHIAVERNRRKQMNEYLAVLRSLMPSSYVQRGDQASIIGGAINFVKELEQLLQSMEGHTKSKQQPKDNDASSPSPPFAQFFSFPQYSTRATPGDSTSSDQDNTAATGKEATLNQKQWAVADIEVTMVDSHANLKILSKKRPRQLLKMVVGFQSLKLSILHLNVTTVEEMVLYSVSVKVEEGCQLNTVDEIAAAVNQLLNRIIQEEAA